MPNRYPPDAKRLFARRLGEVYAEQMQTKQDVRLYVEEAELRALLAELVLPAPVRCAWADWLARRPGC